MFLTYYSNSTEVNIFMLVEAYISLCGVSALGAFYLAAHQLSTPGIDGLPISLTVLANRFCIQPSTPHLFSVSVLVFCLRFSNLVSFSIYWFKQMQD